MDPFKFISTTAPCGVPVHVRTVRTPQTKGWLVIKILIHAGAYLDQIPGTAHFLEHMHGRGFRGHETAEDVQEVYNGLFTRTMCGYVFTEGTKFQAKIKIESIWDALDCLHNIIFYPIFSQDSFIMEKGVIGQELWKHLGNPINIKVTQQMLQDIYGDSIWSNLFITGGLPEDLSRISLDDLVAFKDQHYHLQNMEIIFAGDVGVKKACQYADYFAKDAPTGEKSSRMPVMKDSWPAPSRRELRISVSEKLGVSKSHIKSSLLGIRRPLPKLQNIEVLNILGNIINELTFGLVRTELAGSYSITHKVSINFDHTAFRLSVVMRPDILEKVSSEVQKIFNDFRNTEGLRLLFERKKQLSRNEYAMKDCNLLAVTEHAFLNLLLFDQGIATLAEIQEQIDLVTFEDVCELMEQEIAPYAHWLYQTP